MLPLVFTFQTCKSCSIQPNIQMISSSSWETGIIGLLQVSSSFLSLHFPLSFPLSVRFSLHAQDRNNMEEISCTAETGVWVGGQEEMMRRRVGWGAKFKNISDCRTQGWATAVQQHTYNFSYFCCFFHNIWSLPYKLMTKKVLQLRHKKTRWFCHSNFPSRLPAGLHSVKKRTRFFMKIIPGSLGHRLAKGKPGDQAPVSENNHTAAVPLSKTKKPYHLWQL